VRYHPARVGTLTWSREAGTWTVSGRQFDWGGHLPKGNGGVQRYPQAEWKSGNTGLVTRWC